MVDDAPPVAIPQGRLDIRPRCPRCSGCLEISTHADTIPPAQAEGPLSLPTVNKALRTAIRHQHQASLMPQLAVPFTIQEPVPLAVLQHGKVMPSILDFGGDSKK